MKTYCSLRRLKLRCGSRKDTQPAMKEIERKLSDRRFEKFTGLQNFLTALRALASNITMGGLEKEIPVGGPKTLGKQNKLFKQNLPV